MINKEQKSWVWLFLVQINVCFSNKYIFKHRQPTKIILNIKINKRSSKNFFLKVIKKHQKNKLNIRVLNAKYY